jgi:hypothetical protein
MATMTTPGSHGAGQESSKTESKPTATKKSSSGTSMMQ